MTDLAVQIRKLAMNLGSLTVPKIEPLVPFEDCALAAKLCPRILADSKHGDPTKVYYRASRDSEGNTVFAYHFVWPHQRNEEKGFMPALSRILYSNGIRMHAVVYGKEDVELILVKANAAGEIISVGYSKAENYDPKSLKVKHKFVEQSMVGKGPPTFSIDTWNHLFKLTDYKDERLTTLTPQYLSDKVWREYEITRERTCFAETGIMQILN